MWCDGVAWSLKRWGLSSCNCSKNPVFLLVMVSVDHFILCQIWCSVTALIILQEHNAPSPCHIDISLQSPQTFPPNSIIFLSLLPLQIYFLLLFLPLFQYNIWSFSSPLLFFSPSFFFLLCYIVLSTSILISIISSLKKMFFLLFFLLSIITAVFRTLDHWVPSSCITLSISLFVCDG